MSRVFSRWDPVNEREAWLEWRRNFVGGSDIPAICGLSRWGTASTVYLEKVGLLTDDRAANDEAARWGKLLEDVIAEEFCERTGLYLIEREVGAVDSTAPHRGCTLDALVGDSPTSILDDALGSVQIKVSSDWSWEQIPDDYQVQCQWELGVAGFSAGWLVVLHGARRMQIYPLEFDPKVFARLCAIGDRFWFDNVRAKNPPPVDSAEVTEDALKDAYRDRADGSTVVLSEDGVAAALAWLPAEQAVKDAEAHLRKIKNTLRAELLEATVGKGNDAELVTWKPQKVGGVLALDEERLVADFPELDLEKYRKERGTTRVLRATKALKTAEGEG